jgi:hypothetical protein
MRSLLWESLEKSLDANMPDHLPKPIWMGQEIPLSWYTDRDFARPYGDITKQGAPQPSCGSLVNTSVLLLIYARVVV